MSEGRPRDNHIPVDPGLLPRLESLYWRAPLTRYDPLGRLVPLDPREAPRAVFDAIAGAFGCPLPPWVAAFWACNLAVGRLADQAAGELYDHILSVDRAAHAQGAPAELRFFTRQGYGDTRELLRETLWGFAPGDDPHVVRYHHRARDPGARVERLTPMDVLDELAERALMWEAEQEEIPLPTSRTLRAPFELRWEERTPAPEESRPAAPAGPERVRHPKFGDGEVVSRSGAGAQEKLVIDFPDGRRTLLARFVEVIPPERVRVERPRR
ncbi:MAG: hypothetical protein H6710_23480 [Myxococcales bacterium]|nr:hypothetical protein [Myxococcales bacterium]